jgi:GDP-4-dehydro-6-deoxy-D-mannose reductase
MRILVTGAGGFVGRHLLPNLLGAGHEVIAASHAPWEPEVPVTTEVFDVRDKGRAGEVLGRYRPEAVIHLAAQASMRRSWEAVDETFAVNVTGASNVMEAALEAGGPRVLIVGTGQQYGPSNHPLKESDPLQPSSPYGVSKVAQELVGALYRRHFGLQLITARSFNHTGPGQSTEYAVGAFSAQIAEIERGERPPRLSVGWLESRRDFLDVRDVVNAYRLLVEQGEPGEVYNVASGRAHRIGDLLDTLLEVAGLTDTVEVLAAPAPRAGDPEVLVGDSSKLRDEVGWTPEIDLKTSLIDTLNFYRSAGGLQRALRARA